MTKPDSKAFRWRALFACVLLGPAILLATFSHPLFPEGSPLDLALFAMAWLCFVTGAILRFWATIYVGGRKGHQVVSQGPYSLCRHPLYVGTFLLAISVALWLGSPAMLLAVVLLGLVYATVTIPVEERFLMERLGEPYREYCRTTPRLLPSMHRLHSPEVIDVKVSALWLELKRGTLWLLLPILCELLMNLRTADWWPHLFPLS